MIEKIKVYCTDDENYEYTSIQDLYINRIVDPVVGDIFFEAIAVKRMPSDYFSISGLFESMYERAYEDGGEFTYDFPDVTQEKCDGLNEYIKNWFNENSIVSFYCVTDSKEIIWTKDMIDDCKVKND
jgi:hypothetical protein